MKFTMHFFIEKGPSHVVWVGTCGSQYKLTNKCIEIWSLELDIRIGHVIFQVTEKFQVTKIRI